MTYYQNPNPDKFVSEVRKIVEQGMFKKESATWPAVAFMSRIMADNPTQIEEWMRSFESLDDSALEAVQLAAWYSSQEEAVSYFKFKGLDNYLEKQSPDILKMKVENPTTLDMLWGYFFATGDIAPIRRLAIALEHSRYTSALDRYKESGQTASDQRELYLAVTFKSAMWSLESNCRNDSRVLSDCRQIYEDPVTPKAQSLWLGVILSKVDPTNYSIEFEKPKSTK